MYVFESLFKCLAIIILINMCLSRYQDICRGLPAAPTTSTILNAATTIMAEISTSIQQVVVRIRMRIRIDRIRIRMRIRIRINCNSQSGECGRSSWNSSHDPRWVNGSYWCHSSSKKAYISSQKLKKIPLKGFQQYRLILFWSEFSASQCRQFARIPQTPEKVLQCRYFLFFVQWPELFTLRCAIALVQFTDLTWQVPQCHNSHYNL